MSPSGSVAVTAIESDAFSVVLTADGAVTCGARSVLAMVTFTRADPESQTVTELLTPVARHALSAESCTEYGPACVKPGVQENVPEVFPGPATKEPPATTAGPEAISDAIASPSGSEAVTPNVNKLPSEPVTDDGAATMGGALGLPTVMVVVAEPDRALDAVNVTV
jgi:hypothetical protein